MRGKILDGKVKKGVRESDISADWHEDLGKKTIQAGGQQIYRDVITQAVSDQKWGQIENPVQVG